MRVVIAILKILASWPVLVLLLVLLFKDKVEKLLDRLGEAKKIGPVEWGESPTDKMPGEKISTKRDQLESKPTEHKLVKWENVANIYWAGHDLMWASDVILRNAPRDTIIWGLTQSLHHIRDMGLKDDPVAVRLTRLLTNARNSLEKDWTPLMRNEYVHELLAARDYVGSLMNAHQGDFRPRPEADEF